MKRRTFIELSTKTILAGMISGTIPLKALTAEQMNLTTLDIQLGLVHLGASWNQRPRALLQLTSEIRERCNIPIKHAYKEVHLNQAVIMPTPILFLSGKDSFKPPDADLARQLRWILDSGGFLFFDDQEGRADSPFYRSACEMMAAVFPETPDPVALPDDHTLYQSYYLLKKPRGRLARADFLEGWPRGKFTPAMFSHNDLLGALESDRSGNWRYPLEIGGGLRRELCFRLGINLMYYTLTLNYKKDRAFPPVLQRRRRQ